jgi:hypothetical protein
LWGPVVLIRWTAPQYPPLGSCIYCGSTEGLTNEHIIPFALLPKGGDWFLPKASCGVCADITKRFEGVTLGHMYSPLRAKMDLKSRRKRTGKTTALYNYRDGSLVEQEIDTSAFPAVFAGFKWPEPGIMLNQPPRARFVGEFTVKCDEAEMRRHVSDTQAMRVTRAAPDHFGKMLAKIAHAFAVAEFGHAFEPLLPRYILGQEDIGPHLVGGDPAERSEPLRFMHYLSAHICWREGTEHYLAVSIELFAGIGMPRYQVIVGRCGKQLPARQ